VIVFTLLVYSVVRLGGGFSGSFANYVHRPIELRERQDLLGNLPGKAQVMAARADVAWQYAQVLAPAA
jgi:hypothetical protein